MTLSPEVRKDMLDSMARTQEVFMADLMRGYFEDPESSYARQMLIETTGIALARIATRSSDGYGFLQTYVHEIQDIINQGTTS